MGKKLKKEKKRRRRQKKEKKKKKKKKQLIFYCGLHCAVHSKRLIPFSFFLIIQAVHLLRKQKNGARERRSSGASEPSWTVLQQPSSMHLHSYGLSSTSANDCSNTI